LTSNTSVFGRPDVSPELATQEGCLLTN
jgi:hypothetical protein